MYKFKLNKLIIFCVFALLLPLSSWSQVGVGTQSPRGALDINFPNTSVWGLVLPANGDPETNIVNPQDNGSPVVGTMVYDSTDDCLKVVTSTGWSNCLSTSAVNLSENCDINGFEGTYQNGSAFTASNTFSVTISNSGSEASGNLTFAVSDLTLSGVSGSLSVSGVSPTNATIPAGGSQLVTYTLSGTPTSSGTLTGNWSSNTLTCSNTVTVAP